MLFCLPSIFLIHILLKWIVCSYLMDREMGEGVHEEEYTVTHLRKDYHTDSVERLSEQRVEEPHKASLLWTSLTSFQSPWWRHIWI